MDEENLAPTNAELQEERKPQFEFKMLERAGELDTLVVTRLGVRFYPKRNAVAVNGSMHWFLTGGMQYAASLFGANTVAFVKHGDKSGAEWVIPTRAFEQTYNVKEYETQVLLRRDVDAHLRRDVDALLKRNAKLEVLVNEILDTGLSKAAKAKVEARLKDREDIPF